MHRTCNTEIIIEQTSVFKSYKKLILECRGLETHVVAALHDNALSCVTNRDTCSEFRQYCDLLAAVGTDTGCDTAHVSAAFWAACP